MDNTKYYVLNKRTIIFRRESSEAGKLSKRLLSIQRRYVTGLLKSTRTDTFVSQQLIHLGLTLCCNVTRNLEVGLIAVRRRLFPKDSKNENNRGDRSNGDVLFVIAPLLEGAEVSRIVYVRTRNERGGKR